MHKNIQTNPKKSQNLTQYSCCSMLTWEKNLKAIRGNGHRFIPKGGTFPTENHHPCCEKLWFVRSISPNLPQMGQIFYHDMLMPHHNSMHAKFPEFWTNFGFIRITKASTSTFAGEPRCRGVWISSPFLAWEISINPWTHIWFYNPCWCARACACSLILNCAPEMARKPI